MEKIKVKNIFAAVSEKSILDPLLSVLDKQSFSSNKQSLRSSTSSAGLKQSFSSNKKSVKFWGTEGTVKYLKSKGFDATFVVSGFDFDGRVKTLDRNVFVRILADRSRPKHLAELKKLKLEPFDLVVVDLYPPDAKIFPESMDIGGQALIRAAVKNFKNVALSFDRSSLKDLANEIKNSGATSLGFRKKQARLALRFIAKRSQDEAKLLK